MSKHSEWDVQAKDGQDHRGQVASHGTGTLTRRACLGGAAFIVGLGAATLVSTSASAKTSQDVAKYQDKPQGQSKCGTCAQFQAPNACKLVDGTISENGWCQLYTPKAG